MVSLVIVSHSRKISDGLQEMAEQMTPEPVMIVSAGGIDDPDSPLGTDAVRIYEAIEQVYSEDGVVVFADMGAAKMNAEAAIDFFDSPKKERIRYCDAPLVEGILAATVESGGGGTLDSVIKEAKASALQFEDDGLDPDDGDMPGPETLAESIVREYTIQNRLGLHARPAARLVTALKKHDAEVRIRNVTKDTAFINAKSINRVVTLEIRKGHRISVASEGPDAEEVHRTVERLIREHFGEHVEDDPSVIAPATATEQPVRATEIVSRESYRGIPVSPGYAVAPLFFHTQAIKPVETYTVDRPEEESKRFTTAVGRAKDEIRTLMEHLHSETGGSEASIFEAHLLILEDPELIEAVEARIQSHRINAEAAWQQAVEELVDVYKGLGDETIRSRWEDVVDVAGRVIRILTKQEYTTIESDEPIILCLERLKPSDIQGLDMQRINGICTIRGSNSSHAAILAGTLDIPVVFAIGDGIRQVEEGQLVAVDGEEGTIIVDPSSEVLDSIHKRQERRRKRLKAAERGKYEPAHTGDGQGIHVGANMHNMSEIDAVLENGAEAVGVFRTEFLFMNRSTPPGEEEQEKVYRELIQRLRGRTATIRTIDIGGDKPIPYLGLTQEDNPHLGVRGIRYSLLHREFLRTQVQAILKASADGPVKILLPMVSTVEEIEKVRLEIDSIKAHLREERIPFDESVPIGIMVEVPSAAYMADVLAKYIDFFSIGTNDLTQYIMAADRDNPDVVHLFDYYQPAVLRSLYHTINSAKQKQLPISICGEMAGDTGALPLIIGLGVREVSMTPTRIPEFKLDAKRYRSDDCYELVSTMLSIETAEDVAFECRSFVDRHRA